MLVTHSYVCMIPVKHKVVYSGLTERAQYNSTCSRTMLLNCGAPARKSLRLFPSSEVDPLKRIDLQLGFTLRCVVQSVLPRGLSTGGRRSDVTTTMPPGGG